MTDSDPWDEITHESVRMGTLDIDLTSIDYEEINIKGAVPVEVLEDLLRQWRAKQEREALPRSGLTGEGAVIKGCADDLERVIEEHE